ncbi:Hypothetical protein CINCED_3A010243 [Cinara cedri]|uniref:Uncharacterized protein n=1 Tax=Cinara cedri TaxID=506608 RepID=A0A5E4MTU1_9HEMI|nr:Hypothetical protein CINCED_3A010243 [Cinara cedri]
MTTQVAVEKVDATAGNDDDEDDDRRVRAVSALIMGMLLEHFGDGRPVHADVVMDTVQYRLTHDDAAEMAREHRRPTADDVGDAADEDDNAVRCHYYSADDRRRQHEYYCVWADPCVSRAYHRCLLMLVESGRIHVLYDCAGGCGGHREDGRGSYCGNGCEIACAKGTAAVALALASTDRPKLPTATRALCRRRS